jgi:hypothetical protein
MTTLDFLNRGVDVYGDAVGVVTSILTRIVRLIPALAVAAAIDRVVFGDGDPGLPKLAEKVSLLSTGMNPTTRTCPPLLIHSRIRTS